MVRRSNTAQRSLLSSTCSASTKCCGNRGLRFMLAKRNSGHVGARGGGAQYRRRTISRRTSAAASGRGAVSTSPSLKNTKRTKACTQASSPSVHLSGVRQRLWQGFPCQTPAVLHIPGWCACADRKGWFYGTTFRLRGDDKPSHRREVRVSTTLEERKES